MAQVYFMYWCAAWTWGLLDIVVVTAPVSFVVIRTCNSWTQCSSLSVKGAAHIERLLAHHVSLLRASNRQLGHISSKKHVNNWLKEIQQSHYQCSDTETTTRIGCLIILHSSKPGILILLDTGVTTGVDYSTYCSWIGTGPSGDILSVFTGSYLIHM